MTTQPTITTDTDDPITTNETITTHTSRPKNEGQPEYRPRAEDLNRTDHNHSNKRTGTPRHHDPMGRRARRRGRAAVIDSASPATSTTAPSPRVVGPC